MPTILLIDDDKDFCGLASAHFSGQGYTVALAHSGKDGLAKTLSIRPDIILLDIMMPDINGIEVLRELQAEDATSDIPVIIITGKFFDQGMRDVFSQERNYRAFFAKPMELAAVQQKVEALLGK